MPKFTVYIPVDLEHAFDELRKRGVDCSKLFCDAMLGHLSLCDDYEPPANTLEDLAIRLKRLEEWVAAQIDKEEEKEEETEPEVTGTLHITVDGIHALCGSKNLDKTFPIDEHDRLMDHPNTTPCMGCRRLYQKAVERAEQKEKEDGR